MSERLAVVDVEGWQGSEVCLALEAQGWRVSRCRGALRVHYYSHEASRVEYLSSKDQLHHNDVSSG